MVRCLTTTMSENLPVSTDNSSFRQVTRGIITQSTCKILLPKCLLPLYSVTDLSKRHILGVNVCNIIIVLCLMKWLFKFILDTGGMSSLLSVKIKPGQSLKAALIAACSLCLITATDSTAAEKANVYIKYSMAIAAVPIGVLKLNSRFDGNKFRIDANGRTAGVSRLVSDGKGSFSTSGSLRRGKVVPSSFNMDTIEENLITKVRMKMASGSIKKLFAAPPLSKKPDRIPVKSQHWRNILDPLSAFMVPLGQDGRIEPREACNRTIPVFDGWQRFDVKLRYKEKRNVNIGGSNGYNGPVVICKAFYLPIAGHRPNRSTTVYLKNKSKMELWLAPISGLPVLVPVNIKVGTKFGTLTLGVSEFALSLGSKAASKSN